MKHAKRILVKARDILVIAYELTIFVVPVVWFLLLAEKGITNNYIIFLPLFVFWFPCMSHVGIFGDKLKLLVDKIMGYEDNPSSKIDAHRENTEFAENRKEKK